MKIPGKREALNRDQHVKFTDYSRMKKSKSMKVDRFFKNLFRLYML